MLKYLQNRCLRPKYRFYTSFYRKIDFFFEFFFCSGDHSRPFYTHFLVFSDKKKSKTRRGVRAGRSAFLIFFFPTVLHVEKKTKTKQIKKKHQKSIYDLLLRRPTSRRPTFKETCVGKT